MMPIWRIQANAIAILVIALAIPAIAGMARPIQPGRSLLVE